jgi:hypothetical protein
MATCKICGVENPTLPDWSNWDCPICQIEEMLATIDDYELFLEAIAALL